MALRIPTVDEAGRFPDDIENRLEGMISQPGPPGAGVPEGGAPLQVIRKTSAGNTTEWVTPTKSMVGLGNVDNTKDADKPVSTVQAAALAAKVGKGELVVNVKDYGAKGDGVTDDTAAILAAQSAAAYPVKPLVFPSGVFLTSATLTAQNILGDNRQKTIIKYTGTGDAVNAGGGVAYHRRVEHLTILGAGVGTGLNLDTSPAGSYVNLIVQGFDTGILLDGTGASDALYNVFDDVTVQSTTTGVRIQGLSHENRFKNFRINYATTGFDFISGGRNVIESAAIENTTTGVIIRNDGSGGHTTRANVIANSRFEFNTTNIAIDANVEMTGLLFNRYIGGALVDNGKYTMNADITTGTYKGTGVDVGTVTAGAVKAPAVYAQTSFVDARIQFGTSGTTIDRNREDSNPALRVNNINAAALGNIQEWLAAGVLKSRVSASGHLGTRVNVAPSDSTLPPGEAMFWFDSTNGAAKLMVKARQADGTVKTGSLPLT